MNVTWKKRIMQLEERVAALEKAKPTPLVKRLTRKKKNARPAGK